MLVDDENDLRAGLRALSGAAPPQPAERVTGTVGRARQIRRRRAAGVAAAVVLPAVVLGTVTLRPAPARPAVDYTNVANWPDRRDPALAAIERNVLAEWEFNDDVPFGESVRWLYSGRVPEADAVAVAFATCGPDQCSRVVLAHGDPAQMAERPADDDVTNWLTETREVAPGEPVGALSAYVDSAAHPDEGATTVLFVLAAPDATGVTYYAPNREGTGAGSGPLPRVGDAFVADIGYLEADVTITVTRADGSFVYQGTVGDQDSLGNARLIRGIELPPGYTSDRGSSGQVGRNGFNMRDGAAGSEPHVLFVRCVGAQPLRVEMNGAKAAVPCDGRPHPALGPLEPIPLGEWEDDRTRPTFDYGLDSTDPYTVFVVALAKRT